MFRLWSLQQLLEDTFISSDSHSERASDYSLYCKRRLANFKYTMQCNRQVWMTLSLYAHPAIEYFSRVVYPLVNPTTRRENRTQMRYRHNKESDNDFSFSWELSCITYAKPFMQMTSITLNSSIRWLHGFNLLTLNTLQLWMRRHDTWRPSSRVDLILRHLLSGRGLMEGHTSACACGDHHIAYRSKASCNAAR